jgi:transcriptional regulator with XRE-family HTH domain
MIRFGTAIKHFRQRANLTQTALAARLHVTPTYLSAVEHGRKQPSLDLLRHVSEVLGVPEEILLWTAIDWHTVALDEGSRSMLRIAQSIIEACVPGRKPEDRLTYFRSSQSCGPIEGSKGIDP